MNHAAASSVTPRCASVTSTSSELRPYFQQQGDVVAMRKDLDDVDGADLRDLYQEVLGKGA